MDTAGLQIDPEHATGKVKVALADGQPSFDILPDQAYDFIEPGPMLLLVRRTDVSMLYHGTLISRSATSRNTLSRLREELEGASIFIDVNLRNPWWDPTAVLADLDRAAWMKLNE